MVIQKKATENDIYIKKIGAFMKDLWVEYKNISHYILAFVHRSVVNEKPELTPEHNERLEFLWDAVLELIVTSNLFRDFPNKPEWEMTDIRSAIVRWKNLAEVGESINIQEHLLLWKWENMSGGRKNHYILANTIEAIIGAIYIDLWINEAEKFINNYIYRTLNDILKNNLTKDFKTTIQEYSQAEFDITPTYKVVEESWPDHNKNFIVWIYLWEKLLSTWVGSSKKKAQESAAKQWYTLLINNN